MVGKSPRKRDYKTGSTVMEDPVDIESTGEGKRIRLTASQDSSMSPDSEKENEHELMLDSGSDCIPMENSVNIDEEEEPYIDVVSEDSAIQEEENLEDEYSVDDTSAYQSIHHMAHMDNLISSHDDSAIIKSEIFDPAYDEMHQMLVSSGGDYEHTFLNGVDTSAVSSLLDMKSSESELNFTTTTSSSCDVIKDMEADSSNKENTDQILHKDLNGLNHNLPIITTTTGPNSGVSIQATLVSAPGLLPTVPNPVVNINNLNAASVLGGNAPILTTPVFLAQGTPGPAGQTNSIITTHLARLVPSPDGKGYILHLGLTPPSSGAIAASASGTLVSSINSSLSNSVVSSSAILGGTTAIHQQVPTVTSVVNNNNGVTNVSPLPSPPNLNMTIGSSSSEQIVTNNNVSPNAIVGGICGNIVSQTGSVVSSSGSTIVSSTLPTANNININNVEGNIVALSQKSPTGKPEISICGSIAAAVAPISNVSTTIGAEVSNLINGNHSPAELTAAHLSLLDNTQQLLEQQTQQVHLLQQQQQIPTRTKSKRRNSKELRELMELEQISSKPGVDTDRFVICSDGPMNCALCGYNTTSYSSFKSHIICSHPCWRITKKLSRNRLLVEKSVKVSVPVANFSVPNPIPAVPIQQRVQSKKNKKDGNVTSKESKEKANSKDNNDSSSLKKDDSLTSNTNSITKNDENSEVLKDIPIDDQEIVNPEGKRRIYKCTRCLRLFVSEDITVNHIVDIHNTKKPYSCIEVSNDYGKNFSPIYACSQKNCTFTCETIVELEKHKADAHTQHVVYRCQICGYSAESTKAVKEHAVKIHRQQVMMYGLAD